MNVYDQAHSLAKAIKESGEYKEYKEYETEIDKNPDLSKMIKDFQQKSIELQTKQMLGEELTAEMTAGIQSLYQIVLQDPLAANYLQASMRFSLMMKDVYEILGEVSGIGSFLG